MKQSEVQLYTPTLNEELSRNWFKFSGI